MGMLTLVQVPREMPLGSQLGLKTQKIWFNRED